jgi:hypothetical protein
MILVLQELENVPFDAFDLEEELFSNSMVVVGAYEMLENVIFIRLKVTSRSTFIY